MPFVSDEDVESLSVYHDNNLVTKDPELLSLIDQMDYRGFSKPLHHFTVNLKHLKCTGTITANFTTGKIVGTNTHLIEFNPIDSTFFLTGFSFIYSKKYFYGRWLHYPFIQNDLSSLRYYCPVCKQTYGIGLADMKRNVLTMFKRTLDIIDDSPELVPAEFIPIEFTLEGDERF